MATATRSGQIYLLQELPKILDDDLWETITQDLFDTKDRHHSWRFQLNDRFAKLEKYELDRVCHSWIVHGTYCLQSIIFNIDFATALFRPNEWDTRVLQDFFNLLTFHLRLFLGKQECFGKIRAHCSSYWGRRDQPVLECVQAERGFDDWLKLAKNSVRIFEHAHPNLGKNDKLSGATFNELLFRNALQRERSKIVSRPKETSLQDTEDVRNLELKAATEAIGRILEHFRTVHKETKTRFDQKVTKRKVPGILLPWEYWHSRTITVVADMDTGIVVTGATKAVVPKIPILEDAADNISHMRVGEDFGSIIDSCSKDVWGLVRPISAKVKGVIVESFVGSNIVISPEETNLHTNIIDAPTNSVDAYQQIPSSNNGIRSWAFGNDFNFKEPCTRCQRLYAGWILHDKPLTPLQKLKRLTLDLQTGSLRHRPTGFKYPCTYCAETVAAAKIYALYRGTLTLALSKDADAGRASDYVRTMLDAKASDEVKALDNVRRRSI